MIGFLFWLFGGAAGIAIFGTAIAVARQPTDRRAFLSVGSVLAIYGKTIVVSYLPFAIVAVIEMAIRKPAADEPAFGFGTYILGIAICHWVAMWLIERDHARRRASRVNH